MENTELCRLCATEKDTFVDGFVSIYSDEGQRFGLQQKIIKCLHIELCPADTLPKTVCLECCTKLHQCADFVESSTRAQARLRNLLGDIKKPEEENSDIKQERDEGTNMSSSNDASQGQNGEEEDAGPPKYLECVLNDKTGETETVQKPEEPVVQTLPSRASKRKCRLPVRVSIQHGLEDEIADIDNVDLDAAEISRIFADDDYEEVTKRKRRGRKKRATKVAKRRESKLKLKKGGEEGELEDEDLNATDKEGDDENGEEWGEDVGEGDEEEDDEDDESKPRGRGKSRKKKIEKLDLTDYQWMCCDCSEVLPNIQALRSHHSEVHKQNPKYMCTTCSKVFNKYVGFAGHLRRHKDYRKFSCETCGKCFANKKAVESHRAIHSDRKPYTCSVCNKAFRQQSALYVHSRCHLPEELKNKYACDECDKRFSTKPNLVTHKRIHTGIRNFTCDQCGKSFVQKGNLDAHMLTHTTVKPFSCQVCSKSFKTELQLRKHGSVHTGVKPHQCDICGRQFRERGTLREHHRIHTGAMPFSCEFCGKSFRFKGVLTTHRRQHTGERPYSCLECQHHFTNWPNYNKHMKRRHGINTSRQTRSGTSPEGAEGQAQLSDVPQQSQQTLLPQHPQQLVQPEQEQEQQQQHQHQHQASQQPQHGPLSLSTLCPETQLEQQPQASALVHKVEMDAHQSQVSQVHIYHLDNSMSQHSIHSQEEDSMSSHHEIYTAHSVHSPLAAHSGHATHLVSSHGHIPHSSHPAHAHAALSPHNEDEREVRYATEREVLLGQMRERERPHFYNPAPGSAVNTNPYLHQSLHQSLHHTLQQSPLQLPGLYGLPQLPLDPSHLEMLQSSAAAQHR